MTVSSTTNRKTFTGDAVTTSFGTSPVVFFNSSELQVYAVVTATGASTLLVENTGYTVSGGSGSTGTVDTSAGSSPYGAPAATVTLVIVRVLPLTQTDDFVNNDINDAEVLEDRLDKLTMVDQQLDEENDRSIKLPVAETSTTANSELPAAATRASRVLGFDASGDITTYDAGSAVTTSDNVTYTPAGTGATATTVQAKLRETVSVKDFGAVGDGVTDDYAAIVAAIASLPSPAGGVVYFPNSSGDYVCSANLTWDDKPVVLRGTGTGVQDGTGVTIKFPAGVTGITPMNGSGGNGANSGLENLHIEGSDTTTGSNYGVLIRCNAFRAVNCNVEKFGSHGWYVLSDISGSPTPVVSVNANNSLLILCRGRNNYGDGLHTRGDNSNILTTINFDSSGNAGWGYYFDGQVGGVHICPHESGDNTLGGFRFGANGGRDRIFGGYKEASATAGVQIDSGNAGYLNLDFLEMTSSVTDNTTAKNNRITWTASADIVSNRIAVGDASGLYVALNSTGILVDVGKSIVMKNALQDAIWTATVQADKSLLVESAQAKELYANNPVAGLTFRAASAAVTAAAGGVCYGGTTQGTVGAAGGASALPATPTGYVIINVVGTDRVIPFFDKT